MLFFSCHSILRTAGTIEYKESIVHHDSILNASFGKVRGNLPQGKQERARRLKEEFEWKDNCGNPENQPVLHNVNNAQYHVKEAKRNVIMRIIDEIKNHNILPSTSFDAFRKINALLRTY